MQKLIYTFSIRWIVFFQAASILIFSSYLSAQTSPQPLQFETKVFEKKKYYRDPSENKNCIAIARFEYPLFTKGADSEVLSAINHDIQGLIQFGKTPNNQTDRKLKSLEENTEAAFKMCKQYGCPYADFPCISERKVAVVLNQPEVVSLNKFSQDCGPAQNGNCHQSFFISFNPQNGKRYILTDLLKPGSEGKINDLVSPYIPRMDGSKNHAQGLLSWLSDRFMIDTQSLVFVLNAYNDIPAPGKIIFEIPYSKIERLLIPDGILIKLMKENGALKKQRAEERYYAPSGLH